MMAAARRQHSGAFCRHDRRQPLLRRAAQRPGDPAHRARRPADPGLDRRYPPAADGRVHHRFDGDRPPPRRGPATITRAGAAGQCRRRLRTLQAPRAPDRGGRRRDRGRRRRDHRRPYRGWQRRRASATAPTRPRPSLRGTARCGVDGDASRPTSSGTKSKRAATSSSRRRTSASSRAPSAAEPIAAAIQRATGEEGGRRAA